MFAGSILDLEPDTAYEARFVLTDPDGDRRPRGRRHEDRDRSHPAGAEAVRGRHACSTSIRRATRARRIEPAFDGIMCAYYYVCGGGDTTTTARPRVQAGRHDPGARRLYTYHPEFYGPDRTVNVTSPYEGTYYLSASGTPERPIAIKAAGDGDVIFDGSGNFALFNVKAANYNYFEGLTFRNTDIAIWAGRAVHRRRERADGQALPVRERRHGRLLELLGLEQLLHRRQLLHRPRRSRLDLLGWSGDFWAQFNGVDGQKFPPTMASYVAVKLYGPGHVVAYNYVANFHDGIDVETYGNPDGSSAIDGPHYPPREYWDRRPVAIDFYNNYMTNFHDNAIEIDGSLHNIRVMRNMMINSASHPMCNQPAGGGPVYWIRNIAYHAPGGSTRMTSGAAGVLFYNNTILTETSAGSSANVHWRNNLMLGENSAPAIFSVTTNTNYSSSDYNGFRPNPGAAPAFQWNSPRWDVAADYGLGGGEHASPAGGGCQRSGRSQPSARGAPLRDAGRVHGRDAPGSAQRARRLRRVRERAEARRPGSEDGADVCIAPRTSTSA